MPVTDPKVNSPKEDLRLKLFKEPGKARCLPVTVDPRGRTGLDAELDQLLGEVTAALKAKSDKALQPLFHQRLDVSLAALGETLARMEQTYGSPFDVSVYRLWAFNTVDGTPEGLTCAEDGVVAFPQYGYPLQLGAWLQVMGQKELGRIYLSIVPAHGRWNIGAFHVQQWTHDGKDFAAWGEEGLRASREGLKEAAYVKYDLAAKLLDGGRLLELGRQADLIKARDAQLTAQDFDKAVRQAVTEGEIIHTSTLLVSGGAGILVRFRIPEEISVETIKSRCRTTAEALAKKPWTAPLKGVRCGYNLPREEAKTEGIIGGIFIDFEAVRARVGK